MKFFYNPKTLLSLPDYGIEIPLKDERILKIYELLQEKNQFVQNDFSEIQLGREDLDHVHTNEFVSALFGTDEQKRKAIVDTFELVRPDGSFHRYRPEVAVRPLGDLIEKVLLQTRGTILAVKEALISGESFHLGGGLHHAMSFGGRGFCLVNDIVIAAKWAQTHLGAKLIWVIDVDAHKGDGTAELTQGDSTIRTLSIHMKEGWPLDSEKRDPSGKLYPWFIESDVEIGVSKGEEAHYLNLLQKGLEDLEKLDQSRPDLAIVVQGSDPYEKDELPSSGNLKLTKSQMLDRDLLVHHFLRSRQIPVTYVMAGGYGASAHEIYCQFLTRVLSS